LQNTNYDCLRRLYMDDSATKFGYAFYLSYFYRNILTLDRKFEQITLMLKHNNWGQSKINTFGRQLLIYVDAGLS